MAEYDRAAIMAMACEALANGKSLRQICEAEGMPSRSTVQKWLTEDAGLSDQYARARSLQADHYAEEIIEIADNTSAQSDHNRDRLRIDARKWVAAKLAPKKYGDKLDVEHEAGPRMAQAMQWLPPT